MTLTIIQWECPLHHRQCNCCLRHRQCMLSDTVWSTLSDGRIRVKSDNSNFYNRDCTSQNFYRGGRLGCLNSGYGADVCMIATTMWWIKMNIYILIIFIVLKSSFLWLMMYWVLISSELSQMTKRWMAAWCSIALFILLWQAELVFIHNCRYQ